MHEYRVKLLIFVTHNPCSSAHMQMILIHAAMGSLGNDSGVDSFHPKASGIDFSRLRSRPTPNEVDKTRNLVKMPPLRNITV
jgi:hypothetical protein